MFACLIIRALFSVVELQRQLDVPWGLGTCNLSHRGSQAHVWCVELDVVESVNEISSELEAEPLRQQKVLMQTQIYVRVTRRT